MLESEPAGIANVAAVASISTIEDGGKGSSNVVAGESDTINNQANAQLVISFLFVKKNVLIGFFFVFFRLFNMELRKLKWWCQMRFLCKETLLWWFVEVTLQMGKLMNFFF